jgi:hypothetical protein
MYCHAMKALGFTLTLLLLFVACAGEQPEAASSAPTETVASSTTAAPAVTETTASQPPESAEDTDQGKWAGQISVDAAAGIASLNYVGAESGDFVPFRFRTSSDTGRKILAVCAHDDLCEIEGSVRFLDEAPPENASAVGEIIRVDRVKKLPPDAM